MTVVGLGASELDDYVAGAVAQVSAEALIGGAVSQSRYRRPTEPTITPAEGDRTDSAAAVELWQ